MNNMKKREPKENGFMKVIYEFGENSSFHGVKYIIAKDSNIYERIFWTIVVMIGICGSVYMTLIFWDRFSSNPIRITIQSSHKQTSIIPFPGVTVCSTIRQVPEKINQLLDKLILPSNITSENVKDAIPALLGYLQPIEVSKSEVALLDLVFRANGYTSIEKIFAEISPTCTDILLKCRWEQRLMPCENLFRRSNTKDGNCCSFNLRENLIHYKEYRTLYYGLQMGLTLMLDPITSNVTTAASSLSSAGIKILIHSPEDYPGTSSIAKVLGNGTESFIRVLGSQLISSDDIKSLTIEQRNCLFENDKKLEYFNQYRSSNCGTECIMLNMYYYCKCIAYTFPQTDKPVCNISNIGCLTENYDFIYRNTSSKSVGISGKSTASCNCPPQCNDVLYAVQTSSIPLSSVTYTTSNFYQMDSSTDIFGQMVVHIYFGSYYQTVMLRDTITSTYYLLSSFGGVFSLFLGCSFISILEIIYYLYFCIQILTCEQSSDATTTHIK